MWFWIVKFNRVEFWCSSAMYWWAGAYCLYDVCYCNIPGSSLSEDLCYMSFPSISNLDLSGPCCSFGNEDNKYPKRKQTRKQMCSTSAVGRNCVTNAITVARTCNATLKEVTVLTNVLILTLKYSWLDPIGNAHKAHSSFDQQWAIMCK